MPILPIIVLELFSIIFVVSSNAPFQNLKPPEYTLPVFAQDVSNSATTTDQTSSQSTPDQNAPVPSDTTPPTDNPQQTAQPSDISLPNPAESPQESPLNSTLSSPEPSTTELPTQEPQSSPNETNNPQLNPETTGSANESKGINPVVLDENQIQAQAASQTVIGGGDMISGPLENIDKNVEQASNAQDQKLEEAKTPDEKAILSVGFAQDSMKAAEQSLKNDDLQTATYVIQRISDQIDTAVSNAQISSDSKPLQQLSSFCKQADFVFRTQQLAVPEEAVQDFEIVRGKCLNVNQ